MASIASLATLGSGRTNSCVYLESSSTAVRRISVIKAVSFCNYVSLRRWARVSVCKCMVTTTDFLTEQGNSASVDVTLRGSKDEDGDLVLKPALKPAPKPVLKARPKAEQISSVNYKNSISWVPPKIAGDKVSLSPNEKSESVDDNNKVIESLGEVLEKAEKLESANLSKSDTNAGKESNIDGRAAPPMKTRVDRTVNYTGNRKPKTLKSVWRKGNPVAAVEKFVGDLPKAKVAQDNSEGEETVNNGNRVSAQASTSGNTLVQPRIPARPQPPLKPQPRLQVKPVVVAAPVVKKPVILKDVGATPRPATDDSLKTRERKPILIDKFASKKLAADPLLAQVVLAPPKPAKGIGAMKMRDERRKKSSAIGGLKRRMDLQGDDTEIHDDETQELNVSIPGATVARKGRKWSKASRKAARIQAAKAAAPVKVEILEVGEVGMSTEDLAYNLAVDESEILGYFYSKGIKIPVMHTLDVDMVKMICKEYDIEVMEVEPVRVEDMARRKEILDVEDLENLELRPPVLTIMGHVDHGKTTLLDYIRKSKVAASEAGGITQGIGAYKVLVPVDGKPQPCVFLDTPGHEAFGAMRARGARVTDIAIIVVAADDGVRPQTNEAIAHAKAAGVPIVVAINKIDKDGANPERVMQELASIGLMPEEWGGDVPMVQISALKGENVDDLLETVMLIAELQELRANPHRNAKGTVIEAGLEKSRGPIATFIVQNGTLKRGDVVVCGGAFGKVRALFDDNGGRIEEAGPSMAVQVIGLNNVPSAGDEFEVVDSLDAARERAEACTESLRDSRMAAKAGEGKVTLSSLASAVSSGKQSGLDIHQLNIIMKVDVQGSIEAIRQAIQVLPQENITLKFLLQMVGDVNTSDVDLAIASKAIIFGFNVRVPGSVKSYADNKGVEIRVYKIIYELIDDMRGAMEGLLDTVEDQIPIGTAEVRAIFSSGSGRVAGCMVTEGKVAKGCGLRIVRNGKTVYTGILDSLRRVKELVKELAQFREKIRHFGDLTTQTAVGIMNPDEWWMNFGIDDPALQNLAIRILSQTCSSSGCERNWSVFERIHTKRRNRLEHKRLNDLVYTHYNLRLKERYELSDEVIMAFANNPSVKNSDKTARRSFDHIPRFLKVNAGLECGIGVENYTDWEVGDVIEAFNSIQKQRTLEEASATMAAALAGAGVEI